MTVVCAFINHSVLTSVLKAVVLFALPLNSILFSIMCVCVCVFFSILIVSLFKILLQHLLGTV